MRKDIFKYIAMLFFALTQCVAPLVHAHIDGGVSAGSILVQKASLPTLVIDTMQSHVESDETQAITIPVVHPQNEHYIAIDSHPIFSYAITMATQSSRPHFREEEFCPLCPSSPPPSQAPPKH